MKVHIHEIAAKEFEEAIHWYDLQSEGLGSRFKKTTLRVIEKIFRTVGWVKQSETHQWRFPGSNERKA